MLRTARLAVVTLLLAAAALWSPPATAAPSHDRAPAVAGVACTRTSSGSCIKGGQFYPQSKYGKAGYDAQGRRYVCKGDRSHPHWMR